MAKDRDLDEQIESDEELLNFDLDDLSLSEDGGDDSDTEEEIIELVDLVERGSSEDITTDLKVREWSASGSKQKPKTGEIALDNGDGAEDEEEPDLDLSDLSIELEIGAGEEKPAASAAEDEITEADLEGLLEEDDSVTLDFSRGEDLEDKLKPEDEITDADLQALLAESGEQDLEEETPELEPLDLSSVQEEEMELEAPELEPLDISPAQEEEMELEPPGEMPAPDLKLAEEEGFVAEKPSEMLAGEGEELGAGAEEEEEEEEEAGMFEEDLSSLPEEPAETEVLPGLEREAAPGETDVFERGTLAGISEERIEEIITNVVKEVVERVARETMAEVAEKMIGEAIETLKQSLEVSGR